MSCKITYDKTFVIVKLKSIIILFEKLKYNAIIIQIGVYIMKIIQVSDLHIDSKMDTNFSATQSKQRNNEILVSFEKLFNIMEKENVSAMIIAGDMFDTKKVSSKAFTYVLELIKKHSNKTFFYVSGNHDNETKLLESSVNIPSNLIVFDKNFSRYSLSKNVNIGGIRLSQTNAINIGKQIDFDSDSINILVLHGMLTKSSSNISNENIYIGELKDKNIDYLALGHIHSYSSGKIDPRGTYVYSGCLEPRGFDEIGDKGFVMITIDEDSHKITHEFVPHAMRKFVEINTDITGLNNPKQILDKIYENLEGVKNEDIVKINIIGEYDEQTTKGLDLVTSELNQKYYYAKVKDKSKLKISLDDYAGNFSLKGIFIRNVLQNKKIPEELKDDIILTGIKALSKEEID